MMLATDHEEAIAKFKIVVIVRDNMNRRLASTLFDYEQTTHRVDPCHAFDILISLYP